MCWECENPEATRTDYLDYLRGLTDRYGWAIPGVEGDRIRPPWAYTLGLTELGAPELVVTGMKLSRAAGVLNGLAAHVHHASPAEPFQSGDRFTPGYAGAPRVEFVALEHADAHLHIAVQMFGPDVRGLQIVWADDRGRWPWERGFRGTRGGQPVLGIRTAA
jgi:hypothetical protein